MEPQASLHLTHPLMRSPESNAFTDSMGCIDQGPFVVTSQLVPSVSSLSDSENSWEAGQRRRVPCFREGKPGRAVGWGWGVTKSFTQAERMQHLFMFLNFVSL